MFKTGTVAETIDAKMQEFGNKRINPLLDQFVNQQKANETIVRELERT